MKAVIFGASGQDGFYLQKLLFKNSIEVISISRSIGPWLIGDVGNYAFVESIIKDNQPDYIFHLAANSTTNHQALFENHATICNGTINILESAKIHSPHSKIFISGSGLQFVNIGKPISEVDQFEARDAYSIARIQSVYAARYFRMLGLKVFVGYFFNHDSPLRSDRHVNQKIVKAVKEISTGKIEKLELGNIHIKKEFCFAGDVVDAVWKLVNNNHGIFEATIGSGIAHSIIDWLEICFGNFNLDYRDYVISNPNFKSDYNILVSNPNTIKKLGWVQETNINSLCKMMMEYNEK
jgi:GDPmannose 4,6-dehydratase